MFADGTIVGSYRVLRKLGRGGMGAVFACEHVLLGRRAAIKVLLPAFSADPDLVQRLFNEARAVTLIADPGIVQVFDFGHHTDGSAYIVMELLEGETVDQRIRRAGRIEPGEALRLIRLVATSLAAAHAKGIVHRDLKPENIFIVADPVVPGGERTKLLDFGVAKLSRGEPGQDATESGQMMGTPVYMSPEQCRGAHAADQRSDIYSLGCVLMKMLTGAPPFEASGIGDLIVAHICAPPPRASSREPGLPAALDRIVARCLAKSPDERYQSMAELGDALESAERALYGAIDGLPAAIAVRTPTVSMPQARPEAPALGATTLDAASGEWTRSRAHRHGKIAALAFGGAVAAAIVVVVSARWGGGTKPIEGEAARPVAAPVVRAAELAGTVTPAPAPVPVPATATATVPVPVPPPPVEAPAPATAAAAPAPVIHEGSGSGSAAIAAPQQRRTDHRSHAKERNALPPVDRRD